MNTLKKNIVYNFLYQVLVLILPFITAPYLARTIGANGIGIYSFSQSIALYFTYITVLGLSNYGNRTIAEVQNDREKRSIKFWEIYTMQMTTFFISCIIYILYICFFSVDKVSSTIMLIWVLSALFDINWFFFGIEQFKLTVIRNMLIKIFSVICIFCFVHNENDIYKYILIMACSTLLSQIVLWPYLKKFVDFKRVKWNNVKKHYKPNIILFIPVIAVSLYKIMDKIMLGYISNMTEVGYYENAEKIITMVESLIVAIGTVMLPRMSNIFSNGNKESENQYFDFSMIAVIIYSCAVMFGLISIKDVFTEIYFGKEFMKTGVLIGYLAITILFFGIGNVLRTQYLIPLKLDDIYIKSAILGAIVNFIINAIMIPKFNSIGAAIGTVFAEIIVSMYQFYKVRNKVHLKKYIPELIYFIVSGYFMSFIIKLLPKQNNNVITLIMDIVIGGIVYIIFTIIYFFIKKNYKVKKIN